jgi:hypothetical protein
MSVKTNYLSTTALEHRAADGHYVRSSAEMFVYWRSERISQTKQLNTTTKVAPHFMRRFLLLLIMFT